MRDPASLVAPAPHPSTAAGHRKPVSGRGWHSLRHRGRGLVTGTERIRPTESDGPVGPVGYAVVSSQRVVRYATLDLKYLVNASEVRTIPDALP